MTTIVEAILSTLGDEPTSLADIAEMTGLEKSTLSPTLSDMKHKGLVERADGGWILASGAPKRATHEAREAAPSEPPAEPKRRGRRPRAVVPDLPPPVAPHNGDARTLEFALTESGEILVRSRDDNAPWRTMPRADAEALAALVTSRP